MALSNEQKAAIQTAVDQAKADILTAIAKEKTEVLAAIAAASAATGGLSPEDLAGIINSISGIGASSAAAVDTIQQGTATPPPVDPQP